ncbi:HNH endonuclease family protein [Corynebacterium sp. H78]|uniref:HNH endonuclease family protein n=1 Tax=Corynebacterium sp. H78 TaxID=3133417 RepID=UPI00309FCFF7
MTGRRQRQCRGMARTAGIVAVVALACGLGACGVDVDQVSTDLAESQKQANEALESAKDAASSAQAEIESLKETLQSATESVQVPEVLPPAEPERPPAQTGSVDVLRGQLATIEQKGRAPKTGYSRDAFGQRWSDDVTVEFGHNGCDTRNDILRRDLANVVLKPNTFDCVVLSGSLHDPYTGAIIEFQRGQESSQAVQIDHVVAMSDAWQKGAQYWDPATRQNFANDPLNLLAADGPANLQKGDGDAATWVPSNSGFRCQYVARQIAVKHRYGLWATPAEHEALGRWLDTCTVEDEPALAELAGTAGEVGATPQ